MNGVGLEQDYYLLKSMFEAKGYEVKYQDYHRKTPQVFKCDIAVHLEVPRYELISLAPRNVLIPNPEWFFHSWLSKLRAFDEIWCKTDDTLQIFSKYHSNCIFTSFTCRDLFLPNIRKTDNFIHVQGKSVMKGTRQILNVFNSGECGNLYFCSKIDTTNNDHIINAGYLSGDDFHKLFNACLIHLCPSLYEGFGLYIWEAMSAGNVVLTTNHKPMSDFIQDKRYLVEVDEPYKHHLGTLRVPKEADLLMKIKLLKSMQTDELKAIGMLNRERYLTNDKFFRNKINNLI